MMVILERWPFTQVAAKVQVYIGSIAHTVQNLHKYWLLFLKHVNSLNVEECYIDDCKEMAPILKRK